MQELNYTTVNRIFSKVSRDLKIDDFSESDVIEWTGEALEAIDAVTMLEECVQFVEVKNHMVEMPKFTHSIIQIAEHTANPFEVTPAVIQTALCESSATEPDCDCDTAVKYIPVDSNGYPIFDTDRYEWRPFINVQAEFINWVTSDLFNTTWLPVRLANHSFFNSIVCKEIDSDKLYSNSRSEYTIIGGKGIRFSFQDGYVAIAYNRQKLDEGNLPLIPDHFAYTTAITKYVTMMLMGRMWYSGRESYEKRYLKAEVDWQWYCKQAGNRGLMPNGIDQFQNMLDASQYLIPRMHRYNQFFMDMSRPEDRKFQDPDRRNHPNGSNGVIVKG